MAANIEQELIEVEAALRGGNFLTTEAVLIEVLNYFIGYGPSARRQAATMVRDILNDANVGVQTRQKLQPDRLHLDEHHARARDSDA